MPQARDLARIRGEKEEKRLNAVRNDFFEKNKEIEPVDIFDSKEISGALKEKPLSLNPSLRDALESLPLNSVLYSKVFVKICPLCIGMDTIEPYLKRKMLIPILTHPLSEYREDFIELMLRYPYITAESYFLYEQTEFCSVNSPYCEKLSTCPRDWDEYNLRWDKIKKNIHKAMSDSRKADRIILSLTDCTIEDLYPPYKERDYVLRQIEEAALNKRMDLLEPLALTAFVVDGLKSSSLLKQHQKLNMKTFKRLGVG